MSNFITPNELLPIMDEVIILDARGFEDYKRGHIKGAFPVDIDKDLTGPIGEHGGRHPLPDMEQLAKTFETFSHAKSVLKTSNWIDLPLRYQPYSEFCDTLIRRFLK